MVTVSNYAVRETKDGRTFISLELTGGLEFVQSHITGKFYATVRKCNIPSTFSERLAESMIGTKIEGNIVRVQTDPYEYKIKDTGETITLSYSYAYQPAQSTELLGQTQVTEMAMS